MSTERSVDPNLSLCSKDVLLSTATVLALAGAGFIDSSTHEKAPRVRQFCKAAVGPPFHPSANPVQQPAMALLIGSSVFRNFFA